MKITRRLTAIGPFTQRWRGRRDGGLARTLAEEGERLVTPADLRSLLQY